MMRSKKDESYPPVSLYFFLEKNCVGRTPMDLANKLYNLLQKKNIILNKI